MIGLAGPQMTESESLKRLEAEVHVVQDLCSGASGGCCVLEEPT